MGQVWVMSAKEIKRAQVMESLKQGLISRGEAAKCLSLSMKQIDRISKRYQHESIQGLLRKPKQNRAPHSHEASVKTQALELVKTLYADFGPTLAAEQLRKRDNVHIPRETLRRWMIETGLHQPFVKKRKKAHPLRARRSCFGELIQIDGSFHDWFEGRRPKCTLLVFIDDATSELVHLRFVPSESYQSYATSFIDYLLEHGKPMSIYTDKHSVFSVNQKELSEEAAGVTTFAQALQSLTIEPILAHSPQAKGRVERMNRTLQDRLVKELRLHDICDIEEANRFLLTYRLELNERFTVPADDLRNAHSPLTSKEIADLPFLFARKARRKVSKNLTISFETDVYQILEESGILNLKNQEVLVCTSLDGSVTICSSEGVVLKTRRYKKFKNRPLTLDSKELEAHQYNLFIRNLSFHSRIQGFSSPASLQGEVLQHNQKRHAI